VRGILGIGYFGPEISLDVAIPALMTVAFSFFLTQSRISFFRNYSVLLSIFFGWVLFALLGLLKSPPFVTTTVFSWPAPQFSGAFQVDIGVLLTFVIASFLLLTNLIASIDVVEKAVNRPPQQVYNQSSFILGVNQLLAGFFAAVGSVPLSVTSGFILTTNMRGKLPFFLAAALILATSLFPVITSWFASLPVPVGYAALFLPFSQMIGLGLREFISFGLQGQSFIILGLSLMTGMGSMFIPTDSFSSLPHYLIPLLNNGLVIGVVTCMLLEQSYRRLEKYRPS
jgi:xanthine/uracil permease